jgi:hypothetical protein
MNYLRTCLGVFVLTISTALLAGPAYADTSWTLGGNGKWETPGNWSAGAPDSADNVFITNAGAKTVTIDATTAGSPGTLSILSLTLDGPAGALNRLVLDNVGTVTRAAEIYIGATSGGNAALTIGNSSTLTLSSFLSPGDAPNATGNVWLTGGALVVTNHDTWIGWQGIAFMTVSNGTFLTRQMFVPQQAGSRGTFTMQGGATRLDAGLQIGVDAGATGAVVIAGGQFTATHSAVSVGNFGVGSLNVSGTGSARMSILSVGASSGSRGTLTVAGGSLAAARLDLGVAGFNSTNGAPAAVGAAWITGGTLAVTNFAVTAGGSGTVTNDGVIEVGLYGYGQLTQSNGTILARDVLVNVRDGGAFTNNALGNVTVAGGTWSTFHSFIIGDCNVAGATGNVTIAGGSLVVTNGGAATLELRSGILTINTGTLNVDRLVITNSCARFVRNGGTVLTGIQVLDPLFDTDGDGLTNGWEETYGLDPLSGSGNDGPTGDADGDGQTNQQELQAGTAPNNGMSSLRILSVAREGVDVRVRWSVAANRTYVLQVNTAAGPGYTNAFSDFASISIPPGSPLTETNYLDLGVAGSFTSRYYRVRLGP